MTSTKSLRTSFSQRMSVKKRFWRASRVRICARSALVLVTGRNLRWMRKPSWRPFTKTNIASRLDHQILTDHGVFYPRVLYNDLRFELTLVPEAQVVKGSDPNKLKYKLTNIQLEYEVIRSKHLADEATSSYTYGKEFAYDHIMLEEVVNVNRGREARLNIKVNRRSLKGILLLFIVPYTAGTRDSEHYLNPDITKVSVTINGSPNRVYNEGITGIDMWDEVSRFFGTKSKKSGGTYDKPNMNLTKYLTGNKFGFFIDLRSMADTTMHGNGQRLVYTKDGVHLNIERNTTGSGIAKCHIFTISDPQMNIMR